MKALTAAELDALEQSILDRVLARWPAASIDCGYTIAAGSRERSWRFIVLDRLNTVQPVVMMAWGSRNEILQAAGDELAAHAIHEAGRLCVPGEP